MEKNNIIVEERVQDRTIVFNPETGKMYEFNEIESTIWEHIEEEPCNIAQRIQESYDVSLEQVLVDIENFKLQLESAKLVKDANTIII